MKPLITKLTTWKKTDEDEEFVDKAIDSLYKKLKTKNGAIEDLQYAINNPSMPSKCVTIPRSLDGRLQVSHRKGLPHVIYCRIFRWPDLQTPHELRGIDSCEFTFAAKQTEVCVNPYHYERVDIPILPPVLVPKCVEFAPAHSIVHQHTPTISTNGENQSYRPVLPSQSAILSYSSYYQYNNNHHNTSYFNNSPMTSTSSSATGSPQNYMEESSISSSHADSFSSNYSPSNNNNNHNTNNNSNNANTNTNCRHGNIDTIDNISQLIHYQEPTNWCSIFYYELNSRVGEAFYAAYNNVFVDGYTNPCNNYGRRFCLGMFSNVNRNLTTENCRRHIGRGIHLYNDGGDIYVENLSECSVFIQSRNSNQSHGFHPLTVCKLPSAYNLRIFQSKLFADMLKEAIDQGYDSVYELSHHCLIKLSFVKGWGADYYRQDVSSCPCWIEIRLNGPFQWLDKVLKHMGSPNNPVSSVS